jgi:hypothetical protein
MAFLEAFKQHGTYPPLDRGSLAPAVLFPLDTLAPGVQLKAVRATLKTFATLAAWYPGGDTTLLALVLKAIDGPLPTGGAGWTPDKRAQTVAVLLSLRRRAGSHASAWEVLATVRDVLRARALSLHVTHRPWQFERLVAPLPSDPFDPPIPAYLDLALARLPWLHLAVLERPDPSVSVEDAVLDLLRCYGYPSGRASVTQGNLMLLEGKIKRMLAGWPSRTGANAFDRAKGLIAAQASTSCPISGEARARYDAVAWEGIYQSLCSASGDSAADILTVLASKYSAFRRTLVGKAPSASHPLISRIVALSSEWASYSAKRIAGADVCAVSAFDRALLTDLLARSLIDGSLFASFKALCALLAALQVSPYIEIQRLAANGGVPGHEALVYIHRAFEPLFADLGYRGWDGFCGNLLTMIGMNDQTHGKISESVPFRRDRAPPRRGHHQGLLLLYLARQQGRGVLRL